MTIISLQNWVEQRTAIIEYENDSIYLYSYPNNDSSLPSKSLWIANTKKRLLKKSNINDDFAKGIQPYMPIKHCTKNGYIKDFKDINNWEIQWGLDQNSIAVYFKNNIVAIMPEWAGITSDFWGFSIGAKDETPIAWPLKNDNIQIKRFLKEKMFLESWTSKQWELTQDNFLSLYRNLYKGEEKYFSADDNKWPPLGIHYCKSNNLEFLATIGMSQLPMPEYGMPWEDNEEYRRIEIAMIFRSIPNFLPLAQYLSAQAKYPWHYGTHFAHGHTIPCKELLEVGSKTSYIIFVENAKFLPNINIPTFDNKKIRLLFMIPIYETEYNYALKNSSNELIKLIEEADKDPFNIFRNSII